MRHRGGISHLTGRLAVASFAGCLAILPATNSARAEDVGRLIFGIIGNAMGNAMKRNTARASWDGVDNSIKQCLATRHGLSIDALIHDGISADDSRVSPLIAGCYRMAAEERGRVEQAQRNLALLGYDPGPADGVMGGRTSAALRQFQRDQRLPITGGADVATLAQLQQQAKRVSEQDARLGAASSGAQPDIASAPVRSFEPAREQLPAAAPNFPSPEIQLPVEPQPSARDRRRQQIIATYGPEFADHILEGRIVAGMTKEQAFAARGEPSRKDAVPPDDELWYYGSDRVAFFKGKVTYAGP